MAETERTLRGQVDQLKTTVEASAKTQRKDLCNLGILTLDVQDFLAQRLDSLCIELLDAIERLKQSQRSHKDTVLGVITKTQQAERRRA
jgi:hypothetical protein